MRPRFSAANPAAEKVRVLYTSESVIYEGMPVCYDYDATLNIDGYDNTDGAGTTTDEGHQNEGKFNRVEDPADNNIMHFAGVVAGSDLAGVTGDGSQWLDIYVPNGAIVPVRCDVDTTAGITLLAVTVASQEFGYVLSGTSRIVALAMETETALDGTADITLAKLSTDLVLYQDLDGTALSIGAPAGDTVVNQIRVSSAQTAGQFHPLYARADLAAGNTGHCEYGAFQFEMHLYQTAMGGHCNCLTAAAVLESGFVNASAVFEVKAAEFSVEDWSSVAKANTWVCPLKLATYISGTGTAPAGHYMMMFNTLQAGDTPDAWFHAQNPESIAYTTGGDTGATKVGDIKISMQGGFGHNAGYIRVYDGTS